ncbi:beta-propeller fold lactonase family protein [Leifsonia sp. YAF41]|uniref:beta-propeller fold lactonase family protein n=1 Tax=Leifsonia sp. YAF41 TaxID=3233086 RepID=UPI003F97E159
MIQSTEPLVRRRRLGGWPARVLATVALAGVLTLSVSAASADSVVATIPNAGGPGGGGYSGSQTAMSSDGTRLYVSQGSTIAVIDTATRAQIASIAVPGPVAGLAVSPDGSRLYLTQGGTDSVAVVDTATRAIVATVPVGDNPAGIAVSPNGSRIYVVNVNGPGIVSMSVVDTASNTLLASIPSGGQPRSVAVSPDGSRVYMVHYSPLKHDIAVVDTATNAIVATILTGPSTNRVDGVAFAPDGSLMYAASPDADTLSLIDTATNTITTSIPVGDGPADVAVTPDGTRAYVTNTTAGTVSVIDLATNAVVQTVPVAAGPRGITITPDGRHAYVAGTTDVSVLALDTFPAIVTATLPDGTVDAEYAANVETTGSPAPQVTITAGTLPPGLTLDPLTGDLTGTPTSTGTYMFTVTALSTVSGIVSTVTREYTVTIADPTTAPTAPLNLAAELDGGAADLTWTAPTSDGGSPIVGYRIERSIDGGPFSAIVDDTGSPDTAYTDAEIDEGVVYTYRVYALNAVGQSDPSNEAFVDVPGAIAPGSGTGGSEQPSRGALASTGTNAILPGLATAALLLALAGGALLVQRRLSGPTRD